MPKKLTVDDFWERVDQSDPDGCWPWKLSYFPTGYGSTTPRFTGSARAHRVAYVLAYGPISDDLVVDHLCRNKACCNPNHLEAVTQKVNTDRGNLNAEKRTQTHCKWGHEFTSENTYIKPNGNRACRACIRARSRKHYLATR